MVNRRPFVPPGTVVLAIVVALNGIGCDEDCSFADDVVTGNATNPEGVSYPAGAYGATPREGGIPGDIFPNLGFSGYRDSATDGELQTVSLADFYDPEMRHHRLLHLSAVAMWCPYCSRETDQLAQIAPALREEGAAFLQLIIDGPSKGEAPDRCDLDEWIEEHDTHFTVVLDGAARRLGTVVAVGSVPYNAIIDTRTMEVLDSGTGAPDDMAGVIRTWLGLLGNSPQ
jgi:thiol-disulfide isomerase/thioredoxin